MTPRQMGFDDAPKPDFIEEERTGLYLAFTRRFKDQPAVEVVTEAAERFRQIPLTQGKVALIDESDAERVVAHKWYACRAPNGRWYARGSVNGKDVLLHRFILQPPRDKVVDHENHDGLDCRRSNMRVCGQSQNIANARRFSTNTSGYKGVLFHKRARKWVASIKYNARQQHLGCFENKVEAAIAYDQAALRIHGEFAHLNMPFEIW